MSSLDSSEDGEENISEYCFESMSAIPLWSFIRLSSLSINGPISVLAEEKDLA